MDILDTIANSKSVAEIRRLSGIDYDLYEDVVKVKKEYLKLECEKVGLHICESIEESVLTVINNKELNKEQQKLSEICYKLGHVCCLTENDDEIDDQTNDELEKMDNNKEWPEKAEDDKAYVVLWAEGKGIAAFSSKSAVHKWVKKEGKWAAIDWIKYQKPEHKGKKLKLEDKKIKLDSIVTEGVGDKLQWKDRTHVEYVPVCPHCNKEFPERGGLLFDETMNLWTCRACKGTFIWTDQPNKVVD